VGSSANTKMAATIESLRIKALPSSEEVGIARRNFNPLCLAPPELWRSRSPPQQDQALRHEEALAAPGLHMPRESGN
jgi:hypothetical protein